MSTYDEWDDVCSCEINSLITSHGAWVPLQMGVLPGI